MPIISHDYKDIDYLEHCIIKKDGTPLQGEIDMYRRIYRDCDRSEYHWHFWHDVNLPIPVKEQSTIQIDFLLVCEKGIVIVEVKGGRVGVRDGKYYYEKDGETTDMVRTPFEQAEDYKYALMNNRVIDTRLVFITTVCAFPHTRMVKTSDIIEMDQSWRLWSSVQQENNEMSFSLFCEKVIDEDKKRKNIIKPDLSEEAVREAIKNLTFNYLDKDRGFYSSASLESIVEWLQVANLRLFESLRKNQRLVIEGGPGTGKTTLAKAFIKQFGDLQGLYVCWNKLLASRLQYVLNSEGLAQCEVIQFASFLLRIQQLIGKRCLTLEDINSGCIDKVGFVLKIFRESDHFKPYNYIIIDEAHDILDKGAICLLNNCSFFNNGLESGSYMVFYDTEQGYNNKSRQIEGFARQISKHSAHFILDENKRVPTNKKILECARLLADNSISRADIDTILLQYADSIGIERCRGVRSVINILADLCSSYENNIKECVILAHSSTQKSVYGESVYDRIATSIGITELSESNLNSNLRGVPFTSILRFKGLESNHVILVLDSRAFVDGYELYIGMTRAIIDLKIIILE